MAVSDRLLDQLACAARCARLAWTAAHDTGAVEAGDEPDRYVAYAVVRALLRRIDDDLGAEP